MGCWRLSLDQQDEQTEQNDKQDGWDSNSSMSMKGMMMVVLNFTRVFTKGNLEGIRHQDSLRFITREDASRWVKAVNLRNVEGKVDYRVISYDILETVERKG